MLIAVPTAEHRIIDLGRGAAVSREAARSLSRQGYRGRLM